jgi:hypothetical protein
MYLFLKYRRLLQKPNKKSCSWEDEMIPLEQREIANINLPIDKAQLIGGVPEVLKS